MSKRKSSQSAGGWGWGGQGGGGGGPPEYPAVHLKEAILIPIVLLALVALQCCTDRRTCTQAHCPPSLSPFFRLSCSTWPPSPPPPTPCWGETTRGKPSTKLVTIQSLWQLIAYIWVSIYIAIKLGETCLPSLPSLESLAIIPRVGDGAHFESLGILIWSN